MSGAIYIDLPITLLVSVSISIEPAGIVNNDYKGRLMIVKTNMLASTSFYMAFAIQRMLIS